MRSEHPEVVLSIKLISEHGLWRKVDEVDKNYDMSISTVNVSILINGSSVGYFSIQKELG